MGGSVSKLQRVLLNFQRRTSMTFWCFNSRKNLTSRIADMSKPSLNCPTLIFLIATFRPVDICLPEPQGKHKFRSSTGCSFSHLYRRRRRHLHRSSGLSS